jgi:hypothetical protein
MSQAGWALQRQVRSVPHLIAFVSHRAGTFAAGMSYRRERRNLTMGW